ncbi:MAG: endonuclease domain-containing protein [Planctomycetes bacterium]|nr:endonuclease domain-containing protein [Planctomycetota bacterium]
MTAHDLNLFFTANESRLPSNSSTQLLWRICEAGRAGVPPNSETWVKAGPNSLAVLIDLAALLPASGLAAAVVTPDPASDIGAWFQAAAAAAVVLAVHAPTFPIAIAIPASVWTGYLAEGSEDRMKAILREGLIELPMLGRMEVEQVLRRVRQEPVEIPLSVLPVIAEGVPDTFATALAHVTATPTRSATAEGDDLARSAAERFLYEFLQLLPATVGRFELNADAGFRFGPRPAEVDLFARDLGIAIEIDGYYHFRDEENYRRDRQKDWELQRRGILVLRFLADDIILRLEEVRDRILASVALRTAESTA